MTICSKRRSIKEAQQENPIIDFSSSSRECKRTKEGKPSSTSQQEVPQVSKRQWEREATCALIAQANWSSFYNPLLVLKAWNDFKECVKVVKVAELKEYLKKYHLMILPTDKNLGTAVVTHNWY
ncbi:hypothetical protein JAAARDRAFT_49665 [Jaapia argillacea MUCL 33604]|uniref:Uncharacterized protein n=1 Tax=Jaapia argillacea MUCL 33604 TaxID=933084 RepID=A0A067PR87_9AGAM|nr:hypothetical protein JAAARDRAFT_49665 [Jaapia argillacea MUCL 33604]